MEMINVISQFCDNKLPHIHLQVMRITPKSATVSEENNNIERSAVMRNSEFTLDVCSCLVVYFGNNKKGKLDSDISFLMSWFGELCYGAML